MRTYRFVLLLGLVLWGIGQIATGFDPSAGGAARSMVWMGQLLIVIGLAGLAMVWLVRRLLKRHMRPPDGGGGGA